MGELIRRLRYLLRWRRQDEELTEELAFHRRMTESELEAGGTHPHVARAAAQRALGNDLGSREQARDVWIPPRLQDVALDARFAARLLLRDRGFALTAILVLGLGIGVNNMMFTVIHAHTMRGLPIARPDRVLSISTIDERAADRGLSYPELDELRSSARSFAGVGAYATAPVALGDDGRAPDRFDAAYVSANAFATIGVQPVIGRGFADEDDRPGTAPVVILGDTAWASRYARDAGVIGRTVLVNGNPATVIGILPDHSGFPSTAHVWLPLSSMPGISEQRRDARTLRVFGRLRDTVTETDARAEVESMVNQMAALHPETNKGVRARVMPINQRHLGQPTDPAWLAFISAGFLIVLISCANAANLMLARAADRTREIAIRSSLGASRLRVVHQLLIESAVLAAAAGTLGLGISIGAVRLFASAIPANVLPYWMDYSMDGRVLAALAAVSLGAVFVFGLVPAMQASRADVNTVLKIAGRANSGGHRATRRWMVAFMTAELALSVILLSHVVVDLTTNRQELASESAISSPDLVTASIALPLERYRTPQQRTDFYRRVQEQLRTVSGVSALTIVSSLPVSGAAEQRLDVDGRERANGETGPTVWSIAIAPRYFETLGLPMERGRDLSDQDGRTGQNNVVVNRRFVELHFGGGDALGRVIRLTSTSGVAASSTAPWLSIVGVAPDVRQRQGPSADPIVYTPLSAAAPPVAALLARTNSERTAVVASIREEMVALDPNLPLYRTLAMPDVISEAQWNRRVSAGLMMMLTIIAFTLSIVGLYAITAHGVSQQTQEIGMRIALGARAAQVRNLILKRAAWQVALGLLFGVACTIVWSAVFYSGGPDPRRTVSSIDLQYASPSVLVSVGALLAIVTAIACVIPVRRATRLDPVVALRQD